MERKQKIVIDEQGMELKLKRKERKDYLKSPLTDQNWRETTVRWNKDYGKTSISALNWDWDE